MPIPSQGRPRVVASTLPEALPSGFTSRDRDSRMQHSARPHGWFHRGALGSCRSMPHVALHALALCAAIGLAAAPAAAQVGQWAGPFAWPIVAAHAALLPNGKVLA